MNLRIARKVARQHALGRATYSREQLRRCLRRLNTRDRIVNRHACPDCGRQRYRPSDRARPCTYEECPSHAD